MKLLVPAVWGVLWGFTTVQMWRGTYVPDGSLPAGFVKWQFAVLWVAILAFMLWVCGGLKRLQVDRTSLYISNYLRDGRVPLSAIRVVTEMCWINIHPVTIHFRGDTPFGRQITFMPKARIGFALWRFPHPVVEELKSLAAAASDRPDL